MDLLTMFSLYCIPTSLVQIFYTKDTLTAVDVSCNTWMMTAAVQKVGMWRWPEQNSVKDRAAAAASCDRLD